MYLIQQKKQLKKWLYKALKFILGDKNLKKEEELLEDIENQYKEIILKENNNS